MAYGTMGGDAQHTIQAALFTRSCGYRVPLAEALDRPALGRWATFGARPMPGLMVESRLLTKM